jgi:hypothetical protein
MNDPQLVLITHERQFFQLLMNIENLTGQQGLLVRLNASSKVATIVNGHALAAPRLRCNRRQSGRQRCPLSGSGKSTLNGKHDGTKQPSLVWSLSFLFLPTIQLFGTRGTTSVSTARILFKATIE